MAAAHVLWPSSSAKVRLCPFAGRRLVWRHPAKGRANLEEALGLFFEAPVSPRSLTVSTARSTPPTSTSPFSRLRTRLKRRQVFAVRPNGVRSLATAWYTASG